MILSGNIRYILWVKERIGISEEKVSIMERRSAFFYYLLMKAKTIPKWLALWGLVTVPFVLVGAPLMAFGVTVPFALFIYNCTIFVLGL